MQRKSQAWFEKHPRKPPSDQGVPKTFSTHQKEDDLAFYFNRPPGSASTIPITLYSSIFGCFQDDCKWYKPTPDDHSFILDFSREMLNFLPAEKEQAATARRLFESYGIPLRGVVIDSYNTDGDLRHQEHAYTILEVKPELAGTKVNPLLQACWYYAAFLWVKLIENRHLSSNLPCLLIYLQGLYHLTINLYNAE